MRNRRYDVDWVRVLAFDLLILYHIGCVFASFDFHIKNNVIVEWIEHPMYFLSQWRIPLLFVISGMGTRFALSSNTTTRFITQRAKRLLIPLLVGVLIIVPPQVYFERLVEGNDYGSYFEFYKTIFYTGGYPTGNLSWHHLWFLPYLFLITLVTTPILIFLRDGSDRWIQILSKSLKERPHLLFVVMLLPFVFVNLLFSDHEITMSLIGDWYALSKFLLFFLFGYVFISLGDSFWNAVEKLKNVFFIVGVIAYIVLIFSPTGIAWVFAQPINTCSWIFVVLGYSSTYLNRESKIVKYRNKVVYPFYIIHQTIMIVVGYFIIDLNFHYSLKMIILVVATFGGSWFIYHFIVARIPLIQLLFGLKVSSNSKQRL